MARVHRMRRGGVYMIYGKARYVVDRGGSRYAVDDRGNNIWIMDTHCGTPMEFPTRAEAQRVIDSYAVSTRRKMRVIKVWGDWEPEPAR
jgi:hypothetical protein